MTQFFKVAKFENLQHYKDRNPPWIKLYNDLLDDYEFSCLQDASKLHLILIWLLASRTDNRIPVDPEWVSKKIGAKSKIDLAGLLSTKFLELIPEQNQELQTPEHDASNALADCANKPKLVNAKRQSRDRAETEKELYVLPEWIPKHLWDEWMVVRKKKKAVDSPTAITALINNLEEIAANGYTAEYAITKAIEKSWKSVELDWLNNLKNQNGGGNGKPSKLDEAIESINRYRPV